MPTRRQEQMSALIHRQAAKFIQQISNRSSLITVTRASVSRDMRKSTIKVTVLPDSEEESAITFLNRHAAELREILKEETSTKVVPFVEFEIDVGEKNRQALEEIDLDN